MIFVDSKKFELMFFIWKKIRLSHFFYQFTNWLEFMSIMFFSSDLCFLLSGRNLNTCSKINLKTNLLMRLEYGSRQGTIYRNAQLRYTQIMHFTLWEDVILQSNNNKLI